MRAPIWSCFTLIAEAEAPSSDERDFAGLSFLEGSLGDLPLIALVTLLPTNIPFFVDVPPHSVKSIKTGNRLEKASRRSISGCPCPGARRPQSLQGGAEG